MYKFRLRDLRVEPTSRWSDGSGAGLCAVHGLEPNY